MARISGVDLPRDKRVEIGLLRRRRDQAREPLAEIGDVLVRAPAILHRFGPRAIGLGGERPQRVRIKRRRRQPAALPCLAEKGVGAGR